MSKLKDTKDVIKIIEGMLDGSFYSTVEVATDLIEFFDNKFDFLPLFTELGLKKELVSIANNYKEELEQLHLIEDDNGVERVVVVEKGDEIIFSGYYYDNDCLLYPCKIQKQVVTQYVVTDMEGDF